MWLITEHWALRPQEPGHGSMQRLLTQARLLAHSEFVVHSGRQLGGAPKKFGRQEHDAWPLVLRHWALGPQGEGRQGSRIFSGTTIGGGGGMGLQRVNGSPVKPLLQEHRGLWLRTRHSALVPHVPGHGSTHFWFEQALSRLHSELMVHSGRQPGGVPM